MQAMVAVPRYASAPAYLRSERRVGEDRALPTGRKGLVSGKRVRTCGDGPTTTVNLAAQKAQSLFMDRELRFSG